MKLTDISNANLFINAKFASINKQCEIADYTDQIARGQYRTDRCQVMEAVSMSAEEYDEFAHNLLEDRDWLAGKGGTETEADLPQVEHWWQYTEEQQELFKSFAYRQVVAVSAAKRETLYIDPQGYDYARYVGI